jgi:PAS domain S-box-containing protein
MLVCDTRLRVRTIAGPAFGRPRDRSQASGRPVRDVLAQEAWRALAPGLAAALAGEAETVELEGAERGSRYLATCSPIVDDGIVIGATVGARDLAAERGEQAELAALREEFDEVFAHSPIGQALLSVSGRGVRVSDALCALLGRAEADLIGEDAADWVHPDDRRSSAVRFRRLLAGREDVEPTSFRVLAAEGRTVRVRAHVSVLRSPAGWPRGVVFQIEHDDR